MIILFPDGTAIESSTIAAIRMSEASDNHPGRLQVYTFQCRDSLLSFGASRPTAEHFATINVGTNEEARAALKRLTAKWMGLPEPAAIESVTG
jgi:hypothetical protein